MTERTFSIIKPDATRRNLTGKINAVIEDAGLRIVAQRRIRHEPRPGRERSTTCTRTSPFFGELVELHDLGPGGGAGAGRRGRRGALPRGDGRDQPGQRRARHHPQALTPRASPATRCTAPTAPRTPRSRSRSSSTRPISSAEPDRAGGPPKQVATSTRDLTQAKQTAGVAGCQKVAAANY